MEPKNISEAIENIRILCGITFPGFEETIRSQLTSLLKGMPLEKNTTKDFSDGAKKIQYGYNLAKKELNQWREEVMK